MANGNRIAVCNVCNSGHCHHRVAIDRGFFLLFSRYDLKPSAKKNTALIQHFIKMQTGCAKFKEKSKQKDQLY